MALPMWTELWQREPPSGAQSLARPQFFPEEKSPYSEGGGLPFEKKLLEISRALQWDFLLLVVADDVLGGNGIGEHEHEQRGRLHRKCFDLLRFP